MTEKYAGSALYNAIQKTLDGKTTFKERMVVVEPQVNRVLDNNPRRVALLIVNHGTVPVFVSFSAQTAYDAGIILAAEGGSLSMEFDTDFELVGSELWAVSENLDANIYILEVIAS